LVRFSQTAGLLVRRLLLLPLHRGEEKK